MGLFNLNKKYLFLLTFLIVCFIYFQILHKQGKAPFASRVSHFVLGEVQTASVIFRSEVTSLVKKYFFLLGLREENLQLKTKNSQLLSQQSLLTEIQQENKRLKQALTLYEDSPFSLLPAQVTAKDFLYRNDLITINKGSRHGIKKYMGVIHPAGVVGYIFRTTPHSSQVITLLNKLSSLPAINQNNRIHGLIEYYKDENLSFKYFNLKNTVKIFQKNDIIVTSATNQFPPGLPVGSIQKLQNKTQDLIPTIIVHPYVPFSSLEEVFILLSPSEKIL